MEINELKQIVKENFECFMDNGEYKLLPIWESKRVCQCGYAVLEDSGIALQFDVSSSGIFNAKSDEILTRTKTLEHWIAFVRAIKEVCTKIWEKEHNNG